MNAERTYFDPVNAAASYLAHSTDLPSRFAWDDPCKRWRDRSTGRLVPTNDVFRPARDLIHDAVNATDVPLEFRLCFAAPEDVARLTAITSWAAVRADDFEARLATWQQDEVSKAQEREQLCALRATDPRDLPNAERLHHIARRRSAESRLPRLSPSPAPTPGPARSMLPARQRDRLRRCATPSVVRDAVVAASWEDAFRFAASEDMDAREWLRSLPAATPGHRGVKASALYRAFCEAQDGPPGLTETAFGALAIEVLCDGDARDRTRRVRRADGWHYLGVTLPDSSEPGNLAPVVPLRSSASEEKTA
jgi:hypothetical protein